MPFKSKSQVAKCFAMKSRGEAGSWNCTEWARATPNMKNLPKHVRKSPHAHIKGHPMAHKKA